MRKTMFMMLVGLGASLVQASSAKDDYTGVLLWPYVDEASFSGLAVNLFSADFETFRGGALTGLYLQDDVGQGASFSLVSARSKTRFDGFELAGIALEGGMFNGVFASALVTTGKHLRGYAGSIGWNDFDHVDGWSDGILYNRCGSVNGCQTACGFAFCEDSVNGAQIACVSVTRSDLLGFQIGLVNYVGDRLEGIQIGLINIAPGTFNLPLINCGSRTR